jgi:hypothetical protein
MPRWKKVNGAFSDQQIGTRIRARRLQQGLSQAGLGKSDLPADSEI